MTVYSYNPNRLHRVLAPVIEALEIFIYILIKLIYDRINQKVQWNYKGTNMYEWVLITKGQSGLYGLSGVTNANDISFAESQHKYVKHNLNVTKKTMGKEVSNR